jgi:hypothetical protein
MVVLYLDVTIKDKLGELPSTLKGSHESQTRPQRPQTYNIPC